MKHFGSEPTGSVPTVDSIDFCTLDPGSVVEISTRNSTYWVTITKDAHAHGGWFAGVSVMSTSRTFGQVTRSPRGLLVDRLVRVGHSFNVDGSPTSDVTKIKVV